MAKARWEDIKHAKKDVAPCFTKLKDIRGQRVPHGEKAEATAEYLEKYNGATQLQVPIKSTLQKS